jgi:hypothetical protein
MMPIGNSSGNQIIQAPGLVVIRNEMIQETRLVPVDGRPHVGARVRSYMGDSRGRWEGRTLVVDTINFNDSSGGNRPFSRDAHLSERFTRIDRNTIRYEATVDDPRSGRGHGRLRFWRQDPNYYLFEFACHEGNYEHDLDAGRRASQRNDDGAIALSFSRRDQFEANAHHEVTKNTKQFSQRTFVSFVISVTS